MILVMILGLVVGITNPHQINEWKYWVHMFGFVILGNLVLLGIEYITGIKLP